MVPSNGVLVINDGVYGGVFVREARSVILVIGAFKNSDVQECLEVSITFQFFTEREYVQG